jgi:hypothetical protein
MPRLRFLSATLSAAAYRLRRCRSVVRAAGARGIVSFGRALEHPREVREVMDLIFIAVIVAIYALTHGLVVALARLGRIE